MDTLPPFGWTEVVTRWQFAPVVTAATGAAAALYLWGAWRVRRRHPARPWPAWRTGLFLGGLAVIVVATQSGVGSYDDTLFWDHMIQHLMLIMIAPPLLVLGQPATLLLHASRNPLHSGAKRILRSRAVSAITWPPLATAAYAATIVGTHLTGFMTLVLRNDSAHNAEHALYLVVGYLYFLPLLGREPLRWRVSYPARLFLLFLAMPVDAFTGVALGSEGATSFAPATPRTWGPSPIDDVHIGGAVMWIGGAAIMFAVILVVFYVWSRDTRSSGMGWLEAARRANLARLTGEVTSAGEPRPAVETAPASAVREDTGDVDDDMHLAAYNEYLARLNQHGSATRR